VAGAAAAALALAAPLAADAAAPAATVTPAAATPTGYVELSATGLAPNEAVTVTFDSAAASDYVLNNGVQDQTDASGAYDTQVYVPGNATLGSHTITVTGTGPTDSASATVNVVAPPTATVSAPSIALSAYLRTGETATFTGFAPNSTIQAGIGGPGYGNGLGSFTVNGNGVVTVPFVPTAGNGFTTVGTYQISAISADQSIVSRVTFTVTADPVAPVVPAAPPAAPAAPATAVKGAATFTG
jgi:hypothetical protein